MHLREDNMSHPEWWIWAGHPQGVALLYGVALQALLTGIVGPSPCGWPVGTLLFLVSALLSLTRNAQALY